MNIGNIYLCFRPCTKAKGKYAACRQYPFKTTAELLKWLRSRKNSTETIRVIVFKDCDRIADFVEQRNILSQRTEWPLA